MVNTTTQIGFEQLGIGSVLKQNQLTVPPNQREYAWEETQVTQLFQDFARTLNDGDYFLGTIVTIPRANGNLEVVDGQQRLATIAILLAAIRNYLKDKEETMLVEAIDNEFLTGIDRAKRERVPRLTLNVVDNELFRSFVSGNPSVPEAQKPLPESHELLWAAQKLAAQYVRNIVASLDPKDHGDILNKWVSFIEHNALVVLLRVPSDSNAYRMFETLNDRGLRTSQADLIKNYLFGRSEGRANEVQNHWAYMRGALESLDEDDITITFLRHALIVMRGHIREAQVYETVQELVRTENQAASFLATLENLANAYIATFNPQHERWNEYPDSVRRSLHTLDLLNIRPFRPIILAIAANMEVKEAVKSFQLLLAIGVRLMIASATRSGTVEAVLAETANGVFSSKLRKATDLKKSLATITPTDNGFKEVFERTRVSNTKLARYYLRSLEMSSKGEPEPYFIPFEDPSIINLEHILPKKPVGNWPKFSQDDIDTYVNRLGNLCLMRASDNSDLKSISFLEKKKVFAQSEYALTKQISEVSDWEPGSVVSRQENLAKLAVKTWPIVVSG